ncbi:MAG TPA: glycerophosphodiester phosphodiesterase [Burkholderiaceae bacterium]|jgi:glycerophosphoryl diester phosphodiesterase
MWPYPKILAHRGGGTLAPENTIAGLACGVAHGFHAVEFDVMLAKDGVPVLMHDAELGRTVSGKGKVSDYTARQLAEMDAGSWLAFEFTGESVPTYASALHYCQTHKMWMNVEIKPAPGTEKETGRAIAELTQKLLSAEIALHLPGVNDDTLPLFSSFSYDALMAAKEAAPEIPRGYLVDVVPPDWREQLLHLGAITLHTNQKNLTKEQAQAIKKAGFGLFCYTVNDPARAKELLSWGVDAYCTDRVDLIEPDLKSPR